MSSTPGPYTAGTQIEVSNTRLIGDVSRTGALGCFALDKTGRPVLLTCSHVMFPGFLAGPRFGVYQPDYSSCCSGGDKIATPVYNPNDAASYKDGKWKGGFLIQVGQTYRPGPMGVPKKTANNETCSLTDCAIARLDPGVPFSNVLKAPGGDIKINGVNREVLDVLGPLAGTTPKREEYVRVFTPRDGGKLIYGTITWKFTEEVVDSIKVDDTPGAERRVTPIFNNGFSDKSAEQEETAGVLPYINQFIILPRPEPDFTKTGKKDYEKFYQKKDQTLNFDHGDSGSVVIDHQGRVIAQIIAKMPFIAEEFVRHPEHRKLIEFTSVAWVGIASPIRGILDQLEITIPPNGFSGTAPSAGATARVFVPGLPEDLELAAQRRGVERLREGLRASRRGKLILGKIGLHRQEVRRLFATVRPIAAAWRELNGQAFYHHCVRSAGDPGRVIPASINGVTRARLAEVLLPLFARYGSPALRRDLERHGAWAADALLHVSTLDDVPPSVARVRGRCHERK
jgi:hypothetical protein